jgi:ABC-type multidrug transport system ATPase subunit
LAATSVVAVSRLGKYFPQIELRRLFSGGSFSGSWVLQDVALELCPGENLSILGPNGSGKTTLLKLIATLLITTQERIFVQGHDTVRRPGALGMDIWLYQ